MRIKGDMMQRTTGPCRNFLVGEFGLVLFGCAIAYAQERPRRINVRELSRILLRESEDAAIQTLDVSTLSAEQLSTYSYLIKFTVLQTSVIYDCEKFMEALLRKGADPNRASPY